MVQQNKDDATALLAAISRESIRHASEVRSDLEQVNSLLQSAVQLIGEHFMGLQQAIEKHHELLTTGQGSSEDAVLALRAIRQHTNDAITALQFEDMTRQLNERSSNRLLGLNKVLIDFTGVQADTADASTQEIEIAAALFDSRSKAIDLEISKSVQQTHLQCGDIELF